MQPCSRIYYSIYLNQFPLSHCSDRQR